MTTAKVFANGRSQAVRLPRAFRFAAKEVSVRREGEAVILEPIKARTWPKDLWRRIRISDRAFTRPAQREAPERPALDAR